MGKLIKNALVFIGGMTAGGYCVVNAALKSDTFITALKDAITNKTVEVVYGSEATQPKRKVSYYDIPRKPRNVNCCLEHCDDIIFKTRDDAENVLSVMADIIQQYGFVTLADVYDIAGVTTRTYAANKYGWRSVNGCEVVRIRDGYFIKLPKAAKIK